MPKGRPKTNPEALRLRGSWLYTQRKAAEIKRQAGKPVRKRSARQAKLPETPAEWERLLTLLPGYDPFEGIGRKYHFDPHVALQAINFIERRLRHVKGPKVRTLFRLEAWQRSFIANLFGWVDSNDLRRYREAILFVPRKNGKTPLAAAITLYMLTEDQEESAEIYGAASTHKQASLVWQHARGMVSADEKLNAICQIFRGTDKSIQIKPDYWPSYGLSTYLVVSSESYAAHGWNMHFGYVDELHAQPDRDLVDAMITATAARAQPLVLHLTTSDYERPGSICNEKVDYAKGICDGTIPDAQFLPCLFGASTDDDWKSPAVWERANPNLDVSVSREFLERECARAQQTPAYENTFKRLHLNIRTAQNVRWIPLDRWDFCAGPELKLDDFRGRPCWGGLDLATSRDLTALVLCFRDEELGVYHLIPIFWIPRGTLEERSRRDRIPYDVWAGAGLIRVTEGDMTDYAKVRADINAIIDEYQLELRELGVDRMFQGAQLCQELSEQDGINAFAFGQGFLNMAEPTKAFEEAVVNKTVRHGGNPVLRWHASNVSVKFDAAGNMRPDRDSSAEKIDGIVAAIMALSRAMSDNKRPSVYETQDGFYVV